MEFQLQPGLAQCVQRQTFSNIRIKQIHSTVRNYIKQQTIGFKINTTTQKKGFSLCSQDFSQPAQRCQPLVLFLVSSLRCHWPQLMAATWTSPGNKTYLGTTVSDIIKNERSEIDNRKVANLVTTALQNCSRKQLAAVPQLAETSRWHNQPLVLFAASFAFPGLVTTAHCRCVIA